MRFTRKLEHFFILMILLSLGVMGYNWYAQSSFENNPLNPRIQKRIDSAQQKVVSLIDRHYGLRPHILLIVSDEFDSRLYGLTSYKDKQLKIYLNKKRFKESEEYMIEEVIPHEYAHAIHFISEGISSKDGHTPKWQEICKVLEGVRCERYVDNEDIVRQKMGL